VYYKAADVRLSADEDRRSISPSSELHCSNSVHSWDQGFYFSFFIYSFPPFSFLSLFVSFNVLNKLLSNTEGGNFLYCIYGEDNIKIDLITVGWQSVEWTRLAQYRD
jgi:hypothetical protein